MKSLFLISTLFLSVISFSQSPLFNYWDFQLDTVSQNQFSIDSTIPDNFIWQIGESHKPFFGNTNVLTTDTLQMYNGPIDASIDMLVVRPNSGSNNEGVGYVIEFDHKIDTDTTSAGGFIELNIDSLFYVNTDNDTVSTWWLKILLNSELDLDEVYGYGGVTAITDNNDTIFVGSILSVVGYLNYYHKIYGYQDSLYNDVNGFTGTYNQYKNFYMDYMFAEGGVKTQDVNDTLNFRFHFISDGTSGGKNGWAIRNIKTGYSIHPTGSINEKSSNNNQIKVYPNPTTNLTTVNINNTENKLVNVEVYSIDGRKIESLSMSGPQLIFDLSKYRMGSYFFKYFIEEELIGYSKIVKQ